MEIYRKATRIKHEAPEANWKETQKQTAQQYSPPRRGKTKMSYFVHFNCKLDAFFKEIPKYLALLQVQKKKKSSMIL